MRHYSMYPNPCSRFLMSSFDVVPPSLGGKILFTSFSSACTTNSSTELYPAASAHFLTLSNNSPSIFTLCEPNIELLKFCFDSSGGYGWTQTPNALSYRVPWRFQIPPGW